MSLQAEERAEREKTRRDAEESWMLPDLDRAFDVTTGSKSKKKEKARFTIEFA